MGRTSIFPRRDGLETPIDRKHIETRGRRDGLRRIDTPPCTTLSCKFYEVPTNPHSHERVSNEFRMSFERVSNEFRTSFERVSNGFRRPVRKFIDYNPVTTRSITTVSYIVTSESRDVSAGTARCVALFLVDRASLLSHRRVLGHPSSRLHGPSGGLPPEIRRSSSYRR